jgi:Protein of unknown function (DUF3071)
MRGLRLVGPSDDGLHLVIEGPSGERFRLAVDERLRAAVRGDLSRLGQIETAGELRPREIQARVRAGESAEQVAESAGVALERVLRFAYPVLQERRRVVAEAQATRIRRGAATSVETLAELVDERLVQRGTAASTLGWDAWRLEDGTWTVQLRWRGTRDHRTSWTFNLGAKQLQADDPAAEQLIAAEFHLRTLTPVTPLAAAAARQIAPEPTRPGRGDARPDARPAGGYGGRRAAAPGADDLDVPAWVTGDEPAGPATDPTAADRSGTGGYATDLDHQAAADRSGSVDLDPDDRDGRTSSPNRRGRGSDADAPGSTDPGSTDPGRTDAGRADTADAGRDGSGPGPAAPGTRPTPADLAGTVSPQRPGTPSTGRTGNTPAQTELPARPAAAAAGHKARPAAPPPAAKPKGPRVPPVMTAGSVALPLPEPADTVDDGADLDGDDERARRAHVPSWDDIVLGIRRRH